MTAAAPQVDSPSAPADPRARGRDAHGSSPADAASQSLSNALARWALDHAEAHRRWADQPIASRLEVIRAFRRMLISRADEVADRLDAQHRHRRQVAPPRGESLVAEVLATADAARWLERHAARILNDRREGWLGRPLWLVGISHHVQRVPMGVVAIIGPANFPFMLPGIQTLQALAAGNAVVLKPGRGSRAVAEMLARLLIEAGLPAGTLNVTDESIASAQAAIGVADLIVMTGSYEAGRAVLRRAAERATPCILELSGCDAMVVLPSAEHVPGLQRVAQAVAFGLRMNASQTCIAPRRIVVPDTSLDALENAIRDRLQHDGTLPTAPISQATRRLIDDAIARGAEPLIARPGVSVLTGVRPDMAIANADVFEPVASIIAVDDNKATIDAVNACDYALNASVWGDREEATAIARRLRVGGVAVNDLIAPTADPRIPFGGTKRSGFGVTRGPEGLLALTRPQVVSTRHHGPYQHLDPMTDSNVALIRRYLRWIHG